MHLTHQSMHDCLQPTATNSLIHGRLHERPHTVGDSAERTYIAALVYIRDSRKSWQKMVLKAWHTFLKIAKITATKVQFI